MTFLTIETLQISVFRFEMDQLPRLLDAFGCANFGGAAFTARLVEYCLHVKFRQQQNDVHGRKQLIKAIWYACEMAKAELASSNKTRFRIWNLKLLILLMRCLLSICFVETKSNGEQHEHVIPLSLGEFESLCRAQIDKLHQIINKVLSRQFSPQLVVLAGGSSRLQCVQKYFSNLGYNTFKLSTINDTEKSISNFSILNGKFENLQIFLSSRIIYNFLFPQFWNYRRGNSFFISSSARACSNAWSCATSSLQKKSSSKVHCSINCSGVFVSPVFCFFQHK